MTYKHTGHRRILCVVLALALLMCSMLSGCVRHGTKYTSMPATFSPEYKLLSVGKELGFDVVDVKYNYTTLTDKQKEIYLNIYNTVENMYKGDVLLAHGATSEDLSTAYNAYLEDNPQHFWVAETMELCWTVTDNMSIGINKLFNSIASLLPWTKEKRTDYSEYTDAYFRMSYMYNSTTERDMAENELINAVREVLSGISPLDSEFDRELYIHDWIADNCTYDKAAYEKFLKEGTVGSRVSIHTAYGAIVEHSATCAGYTRAMQILLSQAGIESRFISGIRQNDDNKTEGISHAWNLVFLNGMPYYVDTTWDDFDLWGIKDGVFTQLESKAEGSQASNRTEHKYFNVSDEFLSKDHWGYTPQFASATNYNYFTYKLLNMSQASPAFKESLTDELCYIARKDKNFLEIYLDTDSSEYDGLVEALFNDNGGLFYDCLVSANEQLGMAKFREDIVYYGVDKKSGMVYAYTLNQ